MHDAEDDVCPCEMCNDHDAPRDAETYRLTFFRRLDSALYGDGDGTAPVYEAMRPEDFTYETRGDGLIHVTATLSRRDDA